MPVAVKKKGTRAIALRFTDEEWEAFCSYVEERGLLKSWFAERAILEKMARDK